jgi:hypothetical protein
MTDTMTSQNIDLCSWNTLLLLLLASHVLLYSPTRYRMIRRGRRLTLFPANNTHKQLTANRLLYTVNCNYTHC